MAIEFISDFEAVSTGEKPFRLLSETNKNKYLVLFFYPKDDTPGCTNECQQFRDSYTDFRQLDCEVVGISRDSLKSHINFKQKYDLPFKLLSDPDETVCQQFSVIKMKNMYGKQVRGIERSTFILDSKGQLLNTWRGVKVEGHVQEVLVFLKNDLANKTTAVTSD
ncbi:peroxiredoxin [Nitrosomonas mobilis]|uniref:thioredoxin-dependent peroxiredoxin n=1 Tax=Nitrosomonas mobilis TaxID=51642 RepID=A0A1G5SBH2_9PROT|nr:peroxiredoxin [Nitrosomonas mobilis]SCZ84545.1 Alkyl hydroperoxide reductase/ Thiol specific antioxidant/ Mal allergen [Nitrosomonas mobilis]HNO75519.1 peroxiredoxin [Nitrosomonas mobilis]